MPDTIIQIPYLWKPRSYQRKLWKYFEDGGKRAAVCWHRRAGKDEVALHMTATAMSQRPATYWHLLPEAAQARKAIWDAVNPHTGKRRIDEVFPKELRAKTLEDAMMIKWWNGATWQVLGSDNYDSLVGSPPAGVVYSEWSLANPTSWAYIKPILVENGGWGLFIYTSRGQNHGADLYNAAVNDPEWFAQKLTVDDTGVFTQPQLEQEKKELINLYGPSTGLALFRQEYYCSFDAAVLGSVYGEWIERAETLGRIRPNIYDPELIVYTAWDLGYDDSTVIIFYQIAPDGIRVIDAYEANQQDVPHYCEILEQRQQQRGYRYHTTHNVPHDAAIKTLQGGGRSIVQQAYERGVKMRVIPASSQANQIAALRLTMGRMWFDSEKAAMVVKACKHYHYKFDQERKIFSKEPVHDWSSHFIDALEIIGLTNQKSVMPDEAEEPLFLHNMTANDVFWPSTDQISHLNKRI